MKKISKIVLFIFIAAVVVISLSFKGKTDDDDFELIKNLEIYYNVVKTLKTNYVDGIVSRDIITVSINKMLEELDPYTVYYPESSIETYRILSDAQYAGIGITIDTFETAVYITDIEDNSSARKNGVMVGDKIMKINNKPITASNMSEIDKLIKGQLNSTIELEIERNNTQHKFTLITENIKSPIVSLSKKIDDFGYIKLESFTDRAAIDFKSSFENLKKQNIKGLIIDLRDNPGGLLHQAVLIVNFFINKNMLVVSSKGQSKISNASYFTENKPIDNMIPIIVLVNNHSASASEIVAGTFQDYDRAVILGQRTYGKGLVQNIVDVGYNSKMKVTISKYYIPSGRCIQEIDYSKNSNKKHIVSNKKFYTTNERVVYEGSGIMPDVEYKSELPEIIKQVENNNLIFAFATEYYNNIDSSSINTQSIDHSIQVSVFIDFLDEHEFFDKIPAISCITKTIEQKNMQSINTELTKTIELLKNQYKKEITANYDYILKLISKQFVKMKLYHSGEIEFSLKHDPEIEKAKLYLANPQKYKTLLSKQQ